MDGIQLRKMNSPITKAIYVAGVTTFCTFLGCWAVLAHQEATGTMSMKPMPAMDGTFVKNAAQGGMAEVKLGQLAQSNGSNDAVKQFGQRMVTDHSKANDQLKDAASKENISVPADISAKDQATYDSLAKLSGPAFDKAYARDMVTDHEKDIADFNKEATSGRKDSIKNFANETLPTLKDHLKQAREMRQAVAGPASTTKKSASGSGQR
jgi:putative membrane protein